VPQVSIIIPSRNERFFTRTIRDVLEKATGSIEVFPVCDGYEPNEYVDDPRVTYLYLPQKKEAQKRQAINLAVSHATSPFIMALDAHCMLGKGFDVILAQDHQEDWISIPRRHRLDAERWCIQPQSDDRPPIDYEYIMYPQKFDPPTLHGFKWDARTRERWDIPLDDTLTFQGSCWFMTKQHFLNNHFMQTQGYGGWGQEAEELSFTTWLRGGRVVTNKRTWYAHLHKGKTYGRMYFLDRQALRACYAFSYDFWIHNKLEGRQHNFRWLLEKFGPLPGWPAKEQWVL